MKGSEIGRSSPSETTVRAETEGQNYAPNAMGIDRSKTVPIKLVAAPKFNSKVSKLDANWIKHVCYIGQCSKLPTMYFCGQERSQCQYGLVCHLLHNFTKSRQIALKSLLCSRLCRISRD